MNKEELIQHFGAMFQGLLTDTANAFETYVDPDVVWENFIPEHIPFGGRYEGHQGMMQYLMQLGENLDMGMPEFTDFVAEGNTLIAMGSETSTSKTTGREYVMPFAWMVKFNDAGKLVYAREFNDTAAIGAAYDA